jgi:hypothetical protein
VKRGGGIYNLVKARGRVKEGASVGVAPWRGRRAAWWPCQEEEAAEPPARVRDGGREGGMAWWAGSACWAARGKKVGWLLGRKLKENSFPNKNWIFEYTKALEICRRRFRRNFDMGIFPKFF